MRASVSSLQNSTVISPVAVEEETENCYLAFADRLPAAAAVSENTAAWSVRRALPGDTLNELGSNLTDSRHPDSRIVVEEVLRDAGVCNRRCTGRAE
ncbi:hypothetical protein MTO96_018778 [Rhipicephalus appendiculatus]